MIDVPKGKATRVISLPRTLIIVTVAAVIGIGAAVATTTVAQATSGGRDSHQATSHDSHNKDKHKDEVCKYVGKPGEGERLKDGQNPVSVDSNATVGTWFDDAQGRSYVLGADDGKKTYHRSDCPVHTPPPAKTVHVAPPTVAYGATCNSNGDSNPGRVDWALEAHVTHYVTFADGESSVMDFGSISMQGGQMFKFTDVADSGHTLTGYPENGWAITMPFDTEDGKCNPTTTTSTTTTTTTTTTPPPTTTTTTTPPVGKSYTNPKAALTVVCGKATVNTTNLPDGRGLQLLRPVTFTVTVDNVATKVTRPSGQDDAFDFVKTYVFKEDSGTHVVSVSAPGMKTKTAVVRSDCKVNTPAPTTTTTPPTFPVTAPTGGAGVSFWQQPINLVLTGIGLLFVFGVLFGSSSVRTARARAPRRH